MANLLTIHFAFVNGPPWNKTTGDRLVLQEVKLHSQSRNQEIFT